MSNRDRKDLLVANNEWNEDNTRSRYLTDIFRYDVSTGVEGRPPTVPSSIMVSDPYPNPFNRSTVIRWEAHNSGDVTLQIIDLRGREVKRLLDHQTMGPGVHEAIWDGKNSEGGDAPTGVYFARLRVGEEVATRKMLLIR